MPANLVIFCPFTPYQFFTSVYYASHIDRTDTELCLIIRGQLANFDTSGYTDLFDRMIVFGDVKGEPMLKREWLRMLYGGRLFHRSKSAKLLHEYRDRAITLICYSDQSTYETRLIRELQSGGYNASICMIEEGENTYYGPRPMHVSLRKRIVRRLLGTTYGNMIGHNAGIDTWIVKYPEKLRQKVPDACIVKQNNIFADREWMDSISRKVECALTNFRRTDRKVVLWISGPIHEQGVSQADETKWLAEAARALGDEYTVYIKTHPRELPHKYDRIAAEEPNVEIVDLAGFEWLPLEFVIGAIAPDVLLTVISSAAFHIYEMGFGGKVIYSYPYFRQMYIDTRMFDDYIAHTNIYGANSVAELLHIIKELPLEPSDAELLPNEDLDIKYLNRLIRR